MELYNIKSLQQQQQHDISKVSLRRTRKSLV